MAFMAPAPVPLPARDVTPEPPPAPPIPPIEPQNPRPIPPPGERVVAALFAEISVTEPRPLTPSVEMLRESNSLAIDVESVMMLLEPVLADPAGLTGGSDDTFVS